MKDIQSHRLNCREDDPIQYREHAEYGKSGQKNHKIDQTHGTGDVNVRVLFVQNQRDDVKAYGRGFRTDA